ncbi:unnamed protein product [Haemonchus placei]|uniref:Uncharacterized protein n=1 Tax=Haemonchus placei TaxID=6290 RepID=A0A3P7Z759_HAEPC|nr:unnamed protein product [Haemonchus placei]
MPFAPNYQLAINAIPAQQSSASNSPRSKMFNKCMFGECHGGVMELVVKKRKVTFK